MDTLAVRLTVPPVGPVEDLHLQVNAPCRAHKLKKPTFCDVSFSLSLHIVNVSQLILFHPGGTRRMSSGPWIRRFQPSLFYGRADS
jgi:hypothetical protein